MTISFNQVPSNVRVPWTYVEFDNSQAQQGPSVQPFTTLIVGQKLAAGTKPELQIVSISDEAQASDLFGRGSNLHMMIKKYRQGDKVTPIKAIAIDDLAAGVAAGGSVTFGGTSIKAGTLALMIGGQKIQVGVADSGTPEQVATAVAAAINANTLLPVSAVVDGTDAKKVNITSRHKGLIGNEIDLRVNHDESDVMPTNLTATFVAMASGAGNPDLAEIIAVLPEDQFNVIVCPWSDATNLALLETELNDRFGPIRQSEGVAFISKKDTVGNLETFGNSRNSPHVSCLGVAGPSQPSEWSAAVAAQIARSAAIDPARPLQTLPLVGIVAPKESEQFNWQERNTLLTDGISTYKVIAGVVQIERSITMYQKNSQGASDISYLNTETMFTLSYIRYDFRNTMLRKYPRHKVANDGTRFAPGQAIITPKIGKAEAVAMFARWEEMGLVEGIDQFKRDLICERNVSNPDRLDFRLSPDLVNQLRVVGSQISFLL
jgi:phage tail sheath gpL-like